MTAPAFAFRRHSVLPGFGPALGITILYLCLIVLLPLSAAFLKTFTVSFATFWETVSSPRVVFSDQNAAFNITYYDQAVTRGREADGTVRRLGDVMFATKQIRFGSDGRFRTSNNATLPSDGNARIKARVA